MKSRRHVIYHKHQSVACMIGLTPAPNPLVHNHVHPPPFFLIGRKTKPYPQPPRDISGLPRHPFFLVGREKIHTSTLSPLCPTRLMRAHVACGTSVLVLLGRTFLVGMSAQLVVCDRTSGSYHGGELLVVAYIHIDILHRSRAVA